MGFRYAHFCANDYLDTNFFPMCFCKMGIVCSLAFLALMFPFHNVRNALQRMNSVVQLPNYKRYDNVYMFLVFEHKNLHVTDL